MLLLRLRPLIPIIRTNLSFKHSSHNIRHIYDLIELHLQLIRIR
jgi:hypothetical protein